jgi:GntR family transcriptional repressor for pyruvate dehydrogenase complex
LVRLFSSHDEAVFDYIDFRRDMEGLPRTAPAVGSDTDLNITDAIFMKMEPPTPNGIPPKPR